MFTSVSVICIVQYQVDFDDPESLQKARLTEGTIRGSESSLSCRVHTFVRLSFILGFRQMIFFQKFVDVSYFEVEFNHRSQ